MALHATDTENNEERYFTFGQAMYLACKAETERGHEFARAIATTALEHQKRPDVPACLNAPRFQDVAVLTEILRTDSEVANCATVDICRWLEGLINDRTIDCPLQLRPLRPTVLQ